VTRRPRRSTLAILVALVILAVMALIATSSIQVLLGRGPVLRFEAIAGYATRLTWNAPTTLAAAIVAVVLGLVLLYVAITPGNPTVLPLAGGDGRTEAGVQRRSLATDLTTTARTADGISKATVTVGRSKVTAAVRTPRADTTGISEKVHGLLTDRLAAIAPARTPRIRVRVSSDRNT